MIIVYLLRAEDMKKLESLRNDRAHLVDQFWDLQGNLSDLVESYGDGFSGEEEDVIVLVKKVKDLSEKMNDLSKDIFQLIGASGNAEERAKEKEQQKQQKDDVAETLFNAKYTCNYIFINKDFMFIFFVWKGEEMYVQ